MPLTSLKPTENNIFSFLHHKMKRSSTFVSPKGHTSREWLATKAHKATITGPLSWCNPTLARFPLTLQQQEATQLDGAGYAPTRTHTEGSRISNIDGSQVEWRARDNRKGKPPTTLSGATRVLTACCAGRHALIIPRHATKDEVPQITSEWSAVSKGIWRMCTTFAWWDVSWWVAVLFSVGSAIFVASALFYWLPQEAPWTDFKGAGWAGGVCSAVGATLFQIGAFLLIVEACNENQAGCFGWALEHAFSRDADSSSSNEPKTSAATDAIAKPSSGYCDHHHVTGIHKRATVELQHPSAGRQWEWWPTWHELTSHYFHEIGAL